MSEKPMKCVGENRTVDESGLAEILPKSVTKVPCSIYEWSARGELQAALPSHNIALAAIEAPNQHPGYNKDRQDVFGTFLPVHVNSPQHKV